MVDGMGFVTDRVIVMSFGSRLRIGAEYTDGVHENLAVSHPRSNPEPVGTVKGADNTDAAHPNSATGIAISTECVIADTPKLQKGQDPNLDSSLPTPDSPPLPSADYPTAPSNNTKITRDRARHAEAKPARAHVAAAATQSDV